MGGVDLCNQKKVSYQGDRRHTMRFIYVSSLILWISPLYSESGRLTRNYLSFKRSYPSTQPSKRSSTSTAFAAHHLPVFCQNRVQRVQGSNEIMVENQTDVWCEICNVALKFWIPYLGNARDLRSTMIFVIVMFCLCSYVCVLLKCWTENRS